MSYSTADVEAMQKCIKSIQEGIDTIRTSVSSFNQTTKNLCDAYHQWHGYDGQLLEDSRRESENIDHGEGNFETVYHDFGVRATQTDDKRAPGFFASIDHDADEIYRTMHGMESYLEFALQSAETIEGQKEAAEEALSDALGGGGGSGGGAGGGGVDTSTIGSRSPLSKSGGSPSTIGTSSGVSPLSSVAASSLIGSRSSSSSPSSSYNPTSHSTSSRYSGGSGSQYNSSHTNGNTSTIGSRSGRTSDSSSNYFNKYGNHSSSGSTTGSMASGRSGGGFSGSAGYMGAGGSSDDDLKKKDLLTSIDDVVKGSSKNRLASSGSPLSKNDKISGSTIIPIVGGLGAVGASGLGLSAFMGAKKDDDDDDDNLEEYEDPNLTEMEDITKRKEPKIIMTQEDLEEYMGNGESDSSETSFTDNKVVENQDTLV